MAKKAATKVTQYEQDMKGVFAFMTIEELREIAEDLQAIVDGKLNTIGTILPDAVDAKIELQVINEMISENE
jgi:hypothetical protein